MRIEVENTQSKVYNVIRRTYLGKNDCKEGEELCSKCKGNGVNGDTRLSSAGYVSDVPCPKCHGLGIVDWVEQVTGKIDLAKDSSGTIFINQVTNI